MTPSSSGRLLRSSSTRSPTKVTPSASVRCSQMIAGAPMWLPSFL
jgi:hypothetical protein